MEQINVLDFTSNIGKMLLSNGAETYRVEDTLSRILASLNISDYEIFATSTGIFISIQDKTKIKRIKKRCLNIKQIIFINDISRKIVSREIDLMQAKIMLDNVVNETKGYSPYITVFSIGIACFFISILFKGAVSDATTTFIVATFSNTITIFLDKKNTKSLLTTSINGVFIALSTLILVNLSIGKNVDNIIISSVMPLLPGVCFTNAIRDIFEGDYISGGSRLFEALVIGIGLATGVGIVLSSWLSIFNDFIIGGIR